MSHVQHPKSVKYIGSDKNHTNTVVLKMQSSKKNPNSAGFVQTTGNQCIERIFIDVFLNPFDKRSKN